MIRNDIRARSRYVESHYSDAHAALCQARADIAWLLSECARKDAALRSAQIALELDESDCAYAPAASEALDLIATALTPARETGETK